MTLSQEFIAADEGARDNPAVEGFGNGVSHDGKGLTITPDPIGI